MAAPSWRARGRGATDQLDAAAAARATLALDVERPRDWRGGQVQTALTVLATGREQLNADRVRSINALTAFVRSHDLGIDARRALTAPQIHTIAAWRRRADPLGLGTARAGPDRRDLPDPRLRRKDKPATGLVAVATGP